MDHLLAYLIALVTADPVLIDIFAGAMTQADFAANQVNVVAEDERQTAAYPRIVIGGDDGRQMSFGDDIAPLFLTGHVRIEIVTQKTAISAQPLAVLMAIQTRLYDLLLGNKQLALPGIKGKIVSPAGTIQPWTVTVWNQGMGRKLPAVDPTFKRHLATYNVQLHRLNY